MFLPKKLSSLFILSLFSLSLTAVAATKAKAKKPAPKKAVAKPTITFNQLEGVWMKTFQHADGGHLSKNKNDGFQVFKNEKVNYNSEVTTLLLITKEKKITFFLVGDTLTIGAQKANDDSLYSMKGYQANLKADSLSLVPLDPTLDPKLNTKKLIHLQLKDSTLSYYRDDSFLYKDGIPPTIFVQYKKIAPEEALEIIKNAKTSYGPFQFDKMIIEAAEEQEE